MRWEQELQARRANKRNAAVHQVALSLLVGEEVKVVGPDAEQVARDAEALALRVLTPKG